MLGLNLSECSVLKDDPGFDLSLMTVDSHGTQLCVLSWASHCYYMCMGIGRRKSGNTMKYMLWVFVSLCCYQDSGFPCFKCGPRTIQNLRKRFHLSLTEEVLNHYKILVFFLSCKLFACDCYIFCSPCSNVYLWFFHLLAAAWMHGEQGSMIITRRFWMEYFKTAYQLWSFACHLLAKLAEWMCINQYCISQVIGEWLFHCGMDLGVF